MDNITFENKGTNTFLVYAFKDTDEIDSLTFGMITNNKIEGFADSLFTQVDSQKYVKYNITSLVTLKQFFDGTVRKKQFLGVLKNICLAFLTAEEYMIEGKTILLDPDIIYVNVSTCEVKMICLPILNIPDNEKNINLFFKNLAFTTQYDQNEDCGYVAAIITYLNAKQGFSLIDFRDLTLKLLGELPPAKEIKKEEPVSPVFNSPKPNIAAMAEAVPQKIPTTFGTVSTSAPSQFNTSKNISQSPKPPMQNKTALNQPQFNIPTNTPKTPTSYNSAPINNNVSANGDKKISFMHLMMHYNKENSQLYKQQKAEKKAGKANPKSVPQINYAVPGSQAKQSNISNTNQNINFAVPGAPVAPINNAVKPQAVNKPYQSSPINNTAPTVFNTPKTQFTVGSANFGDTTVLGNSSIGETTVLGTNGAGAAVLSPYLIRKRNNEKIPINKPLFKIGKERSYVDYFISDNTAVSRSHANIITRGGKYFIVDTNSTNHTYVNGKMIVSNEETEITRGTSIRLANEDFEFLVC